MKEQMRVFVAGHRGMVGSAIVRALGSQENIKIFTRSREELDLTDQLSVRYFFETEHIDPVYRAAAKVRGGGTQITLIRPTLSTKT